MRTRWVCSVMVLVAAHGCGDDSVGQTSEASSSSETTGITMSPSTTTHASTFTSTSTTADTSSTEGTGTSGDPDTSGTTTTGTDTSGATGSESGSTSSSSSSSSSSDDGSSSSTTGMDLCALGCGDDELCDAMHAGSDDDCDGVVDEECGCTPGTQQGCFMGDPALRHVPGCAPGVQSCTDGVWGPCVGGAHAVDACDANDTSSCHALDTRPLVPVSLLDGLGSFGDDAIGWLWTVTCPEGESTCPSNFFDEYAPLVSGEHILTYTKLTEDGDPGQCDVVVRAHKPGLNVTLEWEPDVGGSDAVDLDLYLHEPGDTSPWTVGGDAHSCGWSSCTVNDFALGFGVSWFAGNVAPDPVDWSLSPTATDNDCLYAPVGEGEAWEMLGLGCHNPRYSTPNVNCDAAVTDPNDVAFCHAERVDLDVMPEGVWHRVAVHYYSSHGETYDAHPRVRMWCGDEPLAELGPAGFYDPEEPVTFAPADEDTMWLVADVAMTLDECGVPRCQVEPLYLDPIARTPLLATAAALSATFGPAYPPAP